MTRHTTKQDMLNAIENMQYRQGPTDTAGALVSTKELIESTQSMDEGTTREDVEKVVVLFSGGKSATDPANATEDLKQTGVNVITIGVDPTPVHTEELKDIATSPNQIVIISGYDNMDSVKDDVIDSIQTPVDMTTPVTGRDCRSDKADVIFALDQTLNKVDFDKVVEFVENVMGEFDVSQDNTHVGTIVFHGWAEVAFYLTSDKKEAIQEIRSITPKQGQEPDILGALKLLRMTMFSKSNNGRSNVQNIAIIIAGNTSPSGNIMNEAEKLRNSGVSITAIGIDSNNLQLIEDLRDIAPKTTYIIDNAEKLRSVEPTIIGTVCEQIIAKASVGLSNEEKIAVIAISCAVGTLIILAIIFFICRSRMKATKSEQLEGRKPYVGGVKISNPYYMQNMELDDEESLKGPESGKGSSLYTDKFTAPGGRVYKQVGSPTELSKEENPYQAIGSQRNSNVKSRTSVKSSVTVDSGEGISVRSLKSEGLFNRP